MSPRVSFRPVGRAARKSTCKVSKNMLYSPEKEGAKMEPVIYTVNTINGDYAYMTSDSGVENQVAMFLLPEGADVGSRLLWENFEWTLL